MERSLTFTIDNGLAQSADDGSSLWILQPPSGQQHDHFQEQEEAEFLDDASDNDDDDDLTIREEIAQGYINRAITINLPAWAMEVDFQDLIARHRQATAAHGGGAGEVGDVFVPASSASNAAVAGLEKQAFHAMAEGCGAITVCAICLENFEDGEEVTVMPCSGGHEFHPDCITKWLGKSNTCPLCRHALPTEVMDDDEL